MYAYLDSQVVDLRAGSLWMRYDLSTTPSSLVYASYDRIIHRLRNTLDDSIGYLDATYFAPQYALSSLSITEILAQLGNQSLPLQSTPPVNLNVKTPYYRNAIQIGYRADLALVGKYPPQNYPADELTDITLTRKDIDPSLLQKRALVTINGYLHATDTDARSFWVIDAAKSARIAKTANVGILSFDTIGDLIKIPITEEMVTPLVDSAPLYQGLCIQTTTPLTGYVPLLSFGGYLHYPQAQVLEVHSDEAVTFYPNHTPYLERYEESLNYLDLSVLPITRDPSNPTAANRLELISDATILAYLKLSQSFLVLVPATYFSVKPIYLPRSNVPGYFYTDYVPKYPLITGYGRMPEYWMTLEDGRYAVNVLDPTQNQYVFSQSRVEDALLLNANRLPGRTYRYQSAYFIEMQFS